MSNAPDVYHHICYVLYTFSSCNGMVDPDPYVDQCIHDLVLCDYNTVVSLRFLLDIFNYVTLESRDNFRQIVIVA